MMVSELRYSIIIPAYNAENTISKCVNTIMDQSYDNFEIIVINDGSNDDTLLRLKELKKYYSNFEYYTIENAGPGAARNHGINKANGEYLLFIDADDYLLPNFLATYNEVLEQKDYDLIISSYKTIVYDDGEIVSEQVTSAPNKKINSHEIFLEELYPLMNNQMMYVVWNKIYKSEIVKKNNIKFPNYKSCEDRIFNLRYFNFVESCKVLNQINFEYSFDGKNSLTNKYLPNKFETFIHWYKELIELAIQDYPGFASLFLKGIMSTLMSIHAKNSPLTFKEKRVYIKRALNNQYVDEASSIAITNTTMKQIISLLLGSNSILLNYVASLSMHFFSQTSPRIIEKFKKIY